MLFVSKNHETPKVCPDLITWFSPPLRYLILQGRLVPQTTYLYHQGSVDPLRPRLAGAVRQATREGPDKPANQVGSIIGGSSQDL